MRNFNKVLAIISIAFFASVNLRAEDRSATVDSSKKTDVLSRFSFKTNAFEWLVTVPNFTVEFDLGRELTNKMSLSLSLKYNWNTYHSFVPPNVFDMFEVRPEFRYYWKPKDWQKYWSIYGKDSSKPSSKASEKDPNRMNTRAFYIGAYVDFADYAMKISPTGKQGIAIGFGVSFGYVWPLYTYKKGRIDFELGGSLGLMVTKNEDFQHDHDNYVYTYVKSNPTHLVPFPVISEVKAAFAWRTRSVSEKFKYDSGKWAEKLEKKDTLDARRARRKEEIKLKKEEREREKEAKAKEKAELAKLKQENPAEYKAYIDRKRFIERAWAIKRRADKKKW